MVRRDEGIATVVALMAMMLLSALGLMLVLNSSAEIFIAGNFRNGYEGLYAADAALERAIGDLGGVADWNQILGGSARSGFVDGPPGGTRASIGGVSLDLTQMLNMANCQKASACGPSDLTASTSLRPWGVNNPVWRLYSYGPLSQLLPDAVVDSPYYVTVMVADDPSENDGDPLRDGSSDTNPGRGVLELQADAFGPRGTHVVIEATVARATGANVLRMLSWREVR